MGFGNILAKTVSFAGGILGYHPRLGAHFDLGTRKQCLAPGAVYYPKGNSDAARFMDFLADLTIGGEPTPTVHIASGECSWDQPAMISSIFPNGCIMHLSPGTIVRAAPGYAEHNIDGMFNFSSPAASLASVTPTALLTANVVDIARTFVCDAPITKPVVSLRHGTLLSFGQYRVIDCTQTQVSPARYTVTVDRPIIRPYVTGDQVAQWDYLCSGYEIHGHGASIYTGVNSSAIHALWVDRVLVQDVKLFGVESSNNVELICTDSSCTNVTFRNIYARRGSIACSNNERVAIENCTIQLGTDSLGGLCLWDTCLVEVRNTVMQGGIVGIRPNNGGFGERGVVITGCTFTCTDADTDCLTIDNAQDVTVSNTVVVGAGGCVGIGANNRGTIRLNGVTTRGGATGFNINDFDGHVLGEVEVIGCSTAGVNTTHRNNDLRIIAKSCALPLYTHGAAGGKFDVSVSGTAAVSIGGSGVTKLKGDVAVTGASAVHVDNAGTTFVAAKIACTGGIGLYNTSSEVFLSESVVTGDMGVLHDGTAPVTHIENAKITGGWALNLYAGCARLGSSVKLSGGVNGNIGQGSVTLVSGTPVDIAFPDAVAGDTLELPGATYSYTVTAGSKFTITPTVSGTFKWFVR